MWRCDFGDVNEIPIVHHFGSYVTVFGGYMDKFTACLEERYCISFVCLIHHLMSVLGSRSTTTTTLLQSSDTELYVRSIVQGLQRWRKMTKSQFLVIQIFKNIRTNYTSYPPSCMNLHMFLNPLTVMSFTLDYAFMTILRKTFNVESFGLSKRDFELCQMTVA